MNIKTTAFYFTFLIFSCQVNFLSGVFDDAMLVKAAKTVNKGTEENINLASRQGGALVDRAALSIGTQGSLLVDKAAVATMAQGSKLIDTAGLAAGEQGNILIDKAAKETKETAESLITTAADKAYQVGYDTGYGTVTGVATALKEGAWTAAPYLAIGGILLGGYCLYCYSYTSSPTNQEQISDATASKRIAELKRGTKATYSELSLIECFNNCVFGRRNRTGIPTACETQFHTYASLAGKAQAAQKASIFRTSCPKRLK